MIQFAIAGLVLGGLYAITSTGIVLTYTSAGIVNFAFGSTAYCIARTYYYLLVQRQWSIPAAAFVSIVVLAPLLGVVLWAILFRSLRLSPQLIKVVATVGLSVALPAVATLIFGNTQITTAPGLAPQPVKIVDVGGVLLSLDQIFVILAVAILGLIGFVVLRFTSVGLNVRAMVDSEAMSSLSGTNASVVSVGVWAVSTFLAGLVGVLIAAIIGLSSSNYTLLMAAAFAAVIAGKLQLVGRAAGIALALGVADGLARYELPPESRWTLTITASIPLIVILFCLLLYARRGGLDESGSTVGALDRAIRPASLSSGPPPRANIVAAPTSDRGSRVKSAMGTMAGPAVIFGLIALLPLLLNGYWIGLVGQGMAFGIAFMSYGLVTGEGGMIWLCQIAFAGIGAIATAEFASHHGWPPLAAIVAGGLITVPLGVLVAFVTIRMGELYVALVTLTVAFLIERLVFSRAEFDNFGLGVDVARPSFARTDTAFAYFAIAVFCLVALMIHVLRRSTAGMALAATRSTSVGARAVGVNVVAMKVAVAGAGAFVAGLGGGMLALFAKASYPPSYSTLIGLVWLAVFVTFGVRSNIAAALGGLVFAFSPAIFQSYVSNRLASLPAALFGLGAIMATHNPDGAVVTHAQQFAALAARLTRRNSESGPPRANDANHETGRAPAAETPAPSVDAVTEVLLTGGLK